MLGELYNPTKLALETAREALQVENPMACNIAYGCRNKCSYCYIPYIKKGEMRFPKERPVDLVKKQFDKGLRPEGVFLSFMTEPFLDENRQNTNDLIDFLLGKNIRVATLSKMDVYEGNRYNVRSGMTVCSANSVFSTCYEPNALDSNSRISKLWGVMIEGVYTWISIEPFVPPEYYSGHSKESPLDEFCNLDALLRSIAWTDLIIFGKLNYDKRGNNKEFYKNCLNTFGNFNHKTSEWYKEGEISRPVRCFVKQGTRDFVNREA